MLAFGFVACSDTSSTSPEDEQLKEEIIKADSTATKYEKLKEEIETTTHSLDKVLEEL